ncbi:MAG: zinc ribbon domain-containing protein [Acidobacteriota bacterium]
MKCPVCNAELPSTAKFCGGCGTTLTAPPQPPPFSPEASYEQARPMMNPPPSYGGNTPPTVQKKYKVLRLIAVLIKVFAFIAGAICIIGALVMLAAGVASSSKTSGFGDTGPAALFGGVVGGLLMLVYGVFVFVFLYAYSEWMYVFMDIEENTRVTNEMLSGRK